MKKLSDLKCKAYEVVTKEGEAFVKTWVLDTETFTFKSNTSIYSGCHMSEDAVFVKVSGIQDEEGDFIEEGQMIVDKNGASYEVLFDSKVGFVAKNKESSKLLVEIVGARIVREFPKEIMEILSEKRDAIKQDNSLYEVYVELDVNYMKAKAKRNKTSLSVLRKEALEILDEEFSIMLSFENSEETEENKVKGVYHKGIYKIPNLKIVDKDNVQEYVSVLKDTYKFIKNIVFKKN